MSKKKLVSLLVSVIMCLPIFSQMSDPVQFKTEWKKISETEAEIVFNGKIDEGWHVYSTGLGDDGPTSATFHVDKIQGAQLVGSLKALGNEIEVMDPVFGMQVRFFEHEASFVQKIKLTGGNYKIEGYLEFGACNDSNCLPPTSVDVSYSGEVNQIAASGSEQGKATKEISSSVELKAENMPEEEKMDTVPALGVETGVGETSVAKTDYWHPVIDELNSYGANMNEESHSWIYIFFTGLVGGLLALFTPCVWPIIPMTVSFFLKRTKDKKKGIRDAWTYGASIVVIYVTLGLAITLIFGASALNALSTNAIFNILFFLMLVVFAASFFGAFELTLPSKWSNAVDSKAEQTTGLLSIFLMAFT